MSDKGEPSANSSDIVVRAVSWIQPLGKFRDGILIIASASYIVGYAVWSYNAMQNKLGLLSAIDAQYFIAGAVPIFILLTSYFIGRYLKRLSDQWPAYVGREATGGRLLLRKALILLYNIAIIITMAYVILSRFF